MSWAQLCRAIDKLDTDAEYEIEFADGKVARLSVAVDRSASEPIGFGVDELGFLSPTLERLGDSDAAIVGYSQPSETQIKPSTTVGVALLLRDLKAGKATAMTAQLDEHMLNRIRASSTPASVARIVEAWLRRAERSTGPTGR